MNNIKKRLLSALLCAVLAIPVLASCGKKEAQTDRDFSLATLSAVDPNTVPESAKEFSSVKPGTYTVLCHTPSGGLLDTVGESEDKVDIAVYLRNAELKDRYSIELKELNITGKTVDFVRNSTLSGLVAYDIASLTYSDALLLTVSNSLCPLSELGGYYQNREMFNSALSVGGKQYIEDLNIFAPGADGAYAIAVNRSILRKMGLSDILFSAAVRGELTLEYIKRIASEKGTLCVSGEALDALWAAGGTHFYENGMGDLPSYKTVGGSAEAVYSALKALSDSGILKDRTDYIADAEAEDPYEIFAESAKSNLFTVGTVAQIKKAAALGLELDLLPMPKIDGEAKYMSLVSGDALCTVIPKSDEEKNSVAFALTGMLYEYSLDEALKEELGRLMGAESSHIGEIADIIASSRVFDLPSLYGIGGLYSFLGSSLKNNLLPDAFIEGINDRAQTAVVAIEIMREGVK